MTSLFTPYAPGKLPLNAVDPATFYGGDAAGYADCPFAGNHLKPAA